MHDLKKTLTNIGRVLGVKRGAMLPSPPEKIKLAPTPHQTVHWKLTKIYSYEELIIFFIFPAGFWQKPFHNIESTLYNSPYITSYWASATWLVFELEISVLWGIASYQSANSPYIFRDKYRVLAYYKELNFWYLLIWQRIMKISIKTRRRFSYVYFFNFCNFIMQMIKLFIP